MSEIRPVDQSNVSIFLDDVRLTCERYLQFFPQEEERLAPLIKNLADPSLDLLDRKTIPEGHLCASGIILSPNGDEVLMVFHKILKKWVVPGGHADLEDGSLSNTALRETREETGLHDFEIHPWHLAHGIPLDIDTHPIPESPKRGEGAHQHFDFRYVLTTPDYFQTVADTGVHLDPNEVTNVQSRKLEDDDHTDSIIPALAKIGMDILKA